MKEFDKIVIQAGDVLLVHTRYSFISYLIRKITDSHWNHAALFVNEFHDVIEATSQGVVVNHIEAYLNSNFELKLVRFKEEAFKDKEEYNKAIKIATNRAYSLLGKEYDFFALVGLYVKYTFRGLAKILRLDKLNIFQNRYKFFCSELVCACYIYTSSIVKNLFAGDKHPKQKCDTITPKDMGKSKNVYFLTGLDKI